MATYTTEGCTPKTVRILEDSQFSVDYSGNTMIQYKRQQMELEKQTNEIQDLRRQLLSVSQPGQEDNKDAMIVSLKAQVDKLEARNHELGKIMSMERLEEPELFTIDSTQSSEGSVIRHYIDHDVSTLQVQRISLDSKKNTNILPARWTRSMQNLKSPEPKKIRKAVSCLKIECQDSIDLLDSQVSSLGMPQPITPTPTRGRQSLFKEDFSFEEQTSHAIVANADKFSNQEPEVEVSAVLTPNQSLSCQQDENVTPRRYSNPDKVLAEFSAALAPTPLAESTLEMADQQQERASEVVVPRLAKKPRVLHKAKSAIDIQQPGGPNICDTVGKVFSGQVLLKHVENFRKSDLHPRYFWVHPYTMTLYWSKDGSATSQKRKGLQIIGVSEEVSMRQIEGIFHKTIVVQSTRRSIKATCPDQSSHNTWLKALRYLLQVNQRVL